MRSKAVKSAGRVLCLLLFGGLLAMILPVVGVSYGGDEYYFSQTYQYPRNLIRAVQEALHRQGLNPGDVDGIWGSRTQDALIEFQRIGSMPITGRPDADTVYLLRNKDRQVVRQLQQFLAFKGLYSSPVSGDFDHDTWAAVLKYERANGLPLTGEFHGRTRQELIFEIKKSGMPSL